MIYSKPENNQRRYLQRDVTPDECPWLEDTMKKGTRVFLFHGHTYGLIGPGGVATTEKFNVMPFTELPDEALAPENPEAA